MWSMTNRELISLVVSIVVIVLAVLGAVGYFLFGEEILRLVNPPSANSGATYEERLDESRLLLDASGDAQSATRTFEGLRDSATTPVERGKAELELGIALLSDKRLEEGAELLRAVSLNEEYLPSTRSAAAERLIQYVGSLTDRDFASRFVFVGPVWGEFLDAGKTDRESLSAASRKALEWASAIHGFFTAEFRIADWYAYRLDRVEGAEREHYIQEVHTRLNRGNVHFRTVIDSVRQGLPGAPTREFIANGYLLRAYAVAFLIRNGVKDFPIEVAEGDFKAALALNDDMIGTFFARFHYASFLATLSRETRNVEIRTILDPYFDSRYSHAQVFSYLSFILTDPELKDTTVASDVRALMKIEPRLTSLLSQN